MGIPQLRSEGNDQGGTSATLVVDFNSFTWAANDIIEIVVTTDGTIPTLSSAQGFQLAVDVNGNAASVSTNGGAAGANETATVIFWKRALGSTVATDPSPTIAFNGATSWCLEPNSYSGCRTSGTPYHQIVTGTQLTATTSVTSPSLTSTLANCLFLGLASSAEDDSTFNNWTMTGSAGPSGSSPPSYGWHNGAGNHCAFTGNDGGYATAGGPHNGTTTFGTATKQALIGRILASLPEVFGPDDAPGTTTTPAATPPASQPLSAGDELAVTATVGIEDQAGQAPSQPATSALATGHAAADDLPVVTAPSFVDEDVPAAAWTGAAPAAAVQPAAMQDDIAGSAAAAIVDDDIVATPAPMQLANALATTTSGDEIVPAGAPSAMIEEPTAAASAAAQIPSAAALLSAIGDDFVPPPVASGTGGSSDVQRSFEAPPQSGTLTTVAPIPAWATSTAYVVDPTAGGINRVQNGGTLYQCSQGGTSASSGAGPTSTTAGATVVDAGVHWYVVGPVAGTNTTAGSQILVTVMRGNQAQAGGNVDPTDNDGGSYTVITNNAYLTFTSSFAGVWRRTTAANAKTNFTASAFFGGSSGAGDELSIGWLELKGVPVGAPHAFSHVERASSTGGTVTAAAITTTKRCLIVSYWFGNGTVQSAGSPDTATPAGGLVLVANDSAPLSLTVNGYVQHMVAVRFANPGTFAEVWNATPTDQGAQLVTIAFEDLSTPSIGVDDDVVRAINVGALMSWSTSAPSPAAQADELPVVVTSDDPAAGWSLAAGQLAALAVTGAVDELPLTASIVDDVATGAGAMPLFGAAPAAGGQVDELATTAVVALDEDMPAVAMGVVRVGAVVYATPADEFTPPAVTVLDEGTQVAVASGAPIGAVLYAVPVEDGLPLMPGAEEQSWSFAISWAPRGPNELDPDDEALPSWNAAPPPPPLPVDDDQPWAPAVPGAACPVIALAPDDDLPVVPVDPTTAWEDAIYQWVVIGSGLAPSQVIWANVGGSVAGPAPAGLYISMRIVDVDSVSDDWLISRRENGGVVSHARGTRHPTLELRCFAGEATGARRAELVLARVTAALELPSVGKVLRKGDVGVGTFGKVRVMPGTRSGMLDPLAMVEVQLHIKIDVSEPGGEFVSVDATTPGGGEQTVVKP